MKSLPISTIAAMCGGRLVSGDGAVEGSQVTIDSRKVQAGLGFIFFAIIGERFDAHDFVAQVAEAGAVAVVVSRVPENAAALGCAVIKVPDTLIAFQNLAREHRRMLGALIIGITGSNGKTSTKDMLSAVLRKKYNVFATEGNLNNHLGVPLTLLSMDESHNCGVVEMGMNHFGEIKVLADIALPDAAVITNIGIAHIEHLGSREGIAQEKGTLPEAVPATGLVVLNANDDMSPAIAARCQARVLLAGVGAGEVQATILESTPAGTRFSLNFNGVTTVEIVLPVAGDHMVGNATLAAAIAWHFDVPPQDIADALGEATLTKGRLQIKQVRGITFLDDSYNANPDSMRAGLKTLAAIHVPGRRFAALGRMGELGPHAESGHRGVGEYAATLDLAGLFTVGSDEAASIGQAAVNARPGLNHQHFQDHAACATALKNCLHEGDAVLLKGSRSTAMEKVFTHFEQA